MESRRHLLLDSKIRRSTAYTTHHSTCLSIAADPDRRSDLREFLNEKTSVLRVISRFGLPLSIFHPKIQKVVKSRLHTGSFQPSQKSQIRRRSSICCPPCNFAETDFEYPKPSTLVAGQDRQSGNADRWRSSVLDCQLSISLVGHHISRRHHYAQ